MIGKAYRWSSWNIHIGKQEIINGSKVVGLPAHQVGRPPFTSRGVCTLNVIQEPVEDDISTILVDFSVEGWYESVSIWLEYLSDGVAPCGIMRTEHDLQSLTGDRELRFTAVVERIPKWDDDVMLL